MNINKEHAPAWVKITIWVTIIAFIFAFVAVGFLQVISNLKNTNGDNAQKTTTTTQQNNVQSVAAINAQYQASVASTEPIVKKEPNNQEQVASLAGLYTQWGMSLVALQNNTDAQTQGVEKLTLARQYWEQAYKIDPKNKEVAGDYATSLFYTNDTDGAVKVARQVVKDNPTYSTVWYNLGIFLSGTDKAGAEEALNNAIKYEKDATQKKAAQEALANLKKQK